MLKQIHYPYLRVLAVFFLLVNMWWFHNSYVGVMLGVVYIALFGGSMGALIFKKLSIAMQWVGGIISLLSAFIILDSFVFYLYKLDLAVISIVFVLVSGSILYLQKKYKTPPHFEKLKLHIGLPSAIALILYAAAVAGMLFFLITARTGEALFSPWEVISSVFVPLYVFASVTLIYLLYKHDSYISTIALSVHFFITIGVAFIVYKVGFGFDPFIHYATENLLLNTGTITPKPLYYVGHYSLETTLTYLFQSGPRWIDSISAPLLFSAALPYITLYTLKESFIKNVKYARLSTLGLLIIPFTIFINTTPQAIANIFVLFIVFLSLLVIQKKLSYWIIPVLAITSFFIHPLSGIPALIYAFLLFLWIYPLPLKKLVVSVTVILASGLIPIVFYAASRVTSIGIKFGKTNTSIPLFPSFSKQYNFFLDFAYGYQQYLLIGITLLVIGGIVCLIKHKNSTAYIITLVTGVVLLSNAMLVNKYITFTDLIGAEQGEFAVRLFHIAFFFFLPSMLVAISALFERAQKMSPLYLVFLISLFSFVLAVALYLRYPRLDDYNNSQFVSMSEADYSAVNYIEEISGEEYVVLSNQITAAAALDTFGFTRSYETDSGEIYFYPIPTSGPLHSLYLELLEKPSIEIIENVRKLTGVDKVFVVIPHYWNRFKIINAQLQKEAIAVASLENAISVYSF